MRRLKDRELQRKLDDFSGGEFSRALRNGVVLCGPDWFPRAEIVFDLRFHTTEDRLMGIKVVIREDAIEETDDEEAEK